MSNPGMHISPGKFFLWGTMIVGIWAAFYAGNLIANDGYANVILDLALVLGAIAVLTVRRYWWIPVFFVGCLGFSTTGLGFKLEGTDLMALFGFACLFAMLCMGQLNPKNTQRSFGIFFYLLLLYIAIHAVLYGVENYFNGDTQFKNIAKRYYALMAPLILIWCMDRYAYPKGLRKTINLMVFLSILFAIGAVFVTIFQVSIPYLSGDILNFAWADVEAVNGYLRGAAPVFLLLALCMSSSTPSGFAKTLYRLAVLILLPAAFFGGGRISLLVTILYIAAWLFVRKKWKQVVVGGWLIALSVVFLAIAGHSMDARQLQNMPRSFQQVQRAISLFLPANQVNDSELETSGSDKWHEDLVKGSWEYANQDYQSMIFGNGFKGWDDTIDLTQFAYGEAYDSAVKTAVHMGSSETMFFSILPILGWIGVVLYYGFMIEVLRRNLRVMKLCPEGSLGRSLCQFSFCMILVSLLVSPISGAIPSYGMIFWVIGLMTAEPYLQKSVGQQLAPKEHLPPVFRGQLAKG